MWFGLAIIAILVLVDTLVVWAACVMAGRGREE